MTAGDLGAVSRIAGEVHPAYPESDAVLAERQRLFPAGCLLLEGEGGALGYALAHPWHRARPPALDTPLGALPPRPGVLHLHDLAILPAARGGGAGRRALGLLAALAGPLPLSIVAIAGTAGFWRAQGFREAGDAALEALLRRYDPEARYMERPPGPAA
ncbi:GNAT family N-acetyltransferase [Roseomonas nepalensis]|uniref:GNAT family N-acetyltransferase n=2 Tax=Muricoccus nepalensis TaxID=1854500 RepID=A0A502GCW5_9PROT|nr:GNAT family N-acetyltransferase [Roseomonas nepalensis]